MKSLITIALLLYSVVGMGQDKWTQQQIDKLFSIAQSHESMLKAIIIGDNKRIDSLESRIRWLEGRPYLDIGFFVGGHPNREVWMIDPKGKYSLTLKRFDYIDSTGEIITKQ